MRRLIPIALLAVMSCTASEEASEPEPPAPLGPINAVCPRSGKPVAADSMTEYRGYVVGFCNTHCRDDFAANVTERPDDTSVFDAAIAALQDTED
jgi:hypothetical protein